MPFSPNLDIEHLDANAAQPEVVVDAAIDALDAKITGVVNIGIGASNVASLTQDQQAAGSIFVVADNSPGSTGAITVTFATFGMGVCSIYNSTGHNLTLKYAGQLAAAPVWAPGARGIFQGDKLNIIKLV